MPHISVLRITSLYSITSIEFFSTKINQNVKKEKGKSNKRVHVTKFSIFYQKQSELSPFIKLH